MRSCIHPRSGPYPPTARVGHLPVLLVVAVLAALSVAALGYAPPATATSWQFAPASAPPPPPGVAAASYPVRLGKVGEISFWAPNHGLLITGGTSLNGHCEEDVTVPCGLYAYDGRSWQQLSTVCGGENGRIAWAGPDEFWTISDQRLGQTKVLAPELVSISLCHFLDGQVVGSYAMPLNQPSSYRTMDAAACLSPENCWFGGLLAQPPNRGAFHLHWDGHEITTVYSPQDHEITSMALADQDTLIESVQLKKGDEYESESTEHPAVLHQIDPPGSDVDFYNLLIGNSGCQALECPPLPDYGVDAKGTPVAPEALAGFQLSSDYTLSGTGPQAPQLWAVAEPAQGHTGHPIALRYSQGAWTQVIGNGSGDDPFEAEEGERVLGRLFEGVAAEPGDSAAWVTISSNKGEAHVDRLTAEGKVSERDVLGEAQEVGQRGNAGPIACPAPDDCWLATDEGWLFHLTDGSQLTQDTDPNFAKVITFRPADAGVPQLPPDEPPPDDSLANQAPPPPPLPNPTVEAPSFSQKALVMDVHSRVVHRYTLELTFRLTVKAHVQLLASRNGHRVAQTPRVTLKAGKRRLLLRLNPRRWPNKLDLKATPLEALPTVASGGGGQTKSGPIGSNSVST
jgi:hypothetical protein